MQIDELDLPEVKLVIPRRFGDDRGWFSETWNARLMEEAGLSRDWVQDNHSYSAMKHTLRGLHYQAPPHAQAKLVRVVRGAILDVVVDARAGSPTWLRWTSAVLTAAEGTQILVPEGFLHGFLTLEPDTEVVYKVNAFYNREADGSVRFDDPDIAVDWGVPPEAVTLSEKDVAAPRVADWASPFFYAAP